MDQRAQAEPRRFVLSRFVSEMPPLYLVTLAMVAGDIAGNAHLFVPAWFIASAALIAALMFLSARPVAGVALALIAIAAAGTVPVRQLIGAPIRAASLHRFADDSTVTLEGYLERAPERVERERDLVELHLRVERAGATITQLGPAAGIVRITTNVHLIFHVGDELRVVSRIRFPRNDGNPGEFDYRSWLLRQGIAATMFAEPKKRSPTPIVIIGHREFWFACAG